MSLAMWAKTIAITDAMITPVRNALAYMSGMLAAAASAFICSSVLAWSAIHRWIVR